MIATTKQLPNVIVPKNAAQNYVMKNVLPKRQQRRFMHV